MLATSLNLYLKSCYMEQVHEDAIDWDRLDTTDRQQDRRDELERDLLELVEVFGRREVVAAILGSTLSEEFERMGIGGCLTAINRVLARIIDSKNPRLESACIALASGMSLCYGQNQSDVARKHGVTRAYVSLRVKEIISDLQLPKTVHNKSDKAQEQYRIANRARR